MVARAVAEVTIKPADADSVFAAFDLATKLRGQGVDVEMVGPQNDERRLPSVRAPHEATVTAIIALDDAQAARTMATHVVDGATVMRSKYQKLHLPVVDTHGNVLDDDDLYRDG
jgi:hypothetical protein